MIPPSGPISLRMDAVRKMLSESATFQDWTESADPTAALTRIHMFEVSGATRPFALIVVGDDQMAQSLGVGGDTVTFSVKGSVGLILDAQIPSDDEDIDSAEAAGFWFTNAVGNIMLDLEQLFNKTGHNLIAQSISLVYGPVRSDNVEETYRMLAGIEIASGTMR